MIEVTAGTHFSIYRIYAGWFESKQKQKQQREHLGISLPS